MNLSEIRFVFNRALSLSFSKKKNFLMFILLALCGLMVVFFQGLAIHAGQWIMLSLTFMPFFLCAGVLFSGGIMLIRIYHDEVKKKTTRYRDVLDKSWEVMIGASYFSIPIILSYLFLWMVLGIFLLLKEIPGIGEIFGVILAFGPFLLNLGTLILCVFTLGILFFATPVIALNGLNRIRISQILVKRFKEDIFSNLVLVTIALLPLAFFSGLLTLAAFLTEALCYACENPLHNVLQSFFIMIPFTFLLSPAVVFFFNFAAESHVLYSKRLKTFRQQEL